MKEIKAVLFDMDGVIFDTERVYLEDWKKVFKKYGYEMKKEIYVSVMGTGRINVSETFLSIYGEDLPITQMYEEKDRELFKAIDEGKIPLKEGAKEILMYLKEKGYKTALATSAKRERAMKQLKMGKIEELFDAVVTGDEVEKSKPDPGIFLTAAKKLSEEPENCIVVEDSSAGIKAAYNAKMIGFHVEDLKEADEDILKYCHKNFKNLLEIKEYINELDAKDKIVNK
ncbi:HAD family phosphatase [Clostridium sp. C2-6-12]|uniref:HAD family hydrolase n=1 Tax=Clostridium sp. C2-6-12 TaxID=2698832 RepID=UPI0013693959|nr:HAD family phosphatase [Clostridium sp. C2-6-12]